MENGINCNVNKLITNLIKNNQCDLPSNDQYIYFVNGALLFARISGEYYLGTSKFTFNSGIMAIGQAYTVNIPSNATSIKVTIETTAYYFWSACYIREYSSLQAPLCLYVLGTLLVPICFEGGCNDEKLKSLISEFLLKYPMDEKSDNKHCGNQPENNYPMLSNNCININNNCNSCSSNNCINKNNAYLCQLTDYINIMKDYLPTSLLLESD